MCSLPVSIIGGEELAALEFFADIAVGDLAVLAANLQPLHAVPGEVLMRQGERAVSATATPSSELKEARRLGKPVM